MKKATIFFCFITLAAGWVACKKKSDPKPDTPIDTVMYMPGVHATVNGTSWSNYNVDNYTAGGTGHYTFDYGGTDTNHVKISISVADATGKGVHTLSAAGADKAYYMMDTGTAPVKVYATSGQINITYINDTVIQGTFNFTAGSNAVTNGTFNVSY